MGHRDGEKSGFTITSGRTITLTDVDEPIHKPLPALLYKPLWVMAGGCLLGHVICAFYALFLHSIHICFCPFRTHGLRALFDFPV